MSVIFCTSLFDMYLYFQGKLSLAEEYHQKFGLKPSLYLECSCCKTRKFLPTCNAVLELVDQEMQTGELFTLQWNVELDIQALKRLGKYLTFQYLQSDPIIKNG